MDNKGQAYSTFQLLIAAIVAMAILAILIPIIMQVMGLIKANPTDETKTKLGVLIDSPGRVERTKEVVFDPNSSLAASALAGGGRLPISKDQICMSTGQFQSGEAQFEFKETEDEQRIIFHGNSTQQAKIAIVCNVNEEELLVDIDFYTLEYDEGNSISDACGICAGKGKCCAVVLERS